MSPPLWASHLPPTPLGHHRVPQAEFPVLHSSFSLASYFTQGAASIPSMHYTFSFLRCVHQPVIQSKSERGKQILYVQARKTVLMKLFAGKEKRCCCWEWQYPFLRSRFLLWDGLKHYEWVQALSVFFLLLLLQRNRIINPFKKKKVH